MNEAKLILQKIQLYLRDRDANEDELSRWLEFYICENYYLIEEYNQRLAMFLNNDVVDICEQTEPGLEGTGFRQDISVAYDKINSMVYPNI